MKRHYLFRIVVAACLTTTMLLVLFLKRGTFEPQSKSLFGYETEDSRSYDYDQSSMIVEFSRSNVFKAIDLLKEKSELVNKNEEKVIISKINEVVSYIEKETLIKLKAYNESAIAVVVLACDRVTVRRCLKKILSHRPSAHQFPVIVFQECVHENTTRAIREFGDEIFFIRNPNRNYSSDKVKNKRILGYVNVASHYANAFNRVFFDYGFNNVIVIEDDLEVSCDFFEYFLATLPILRKDETLFCVSAWNDNGRPSLIQTDAPEMLHRTDFFPGLGWMLTKDLWSELAPQWPKIYWDDWIRRPKQRKGRACIRPEISRTKTFAEFGVSRNHFGSHLKRIHLNRKYINFTQLDLTYLLSGNYDWKFFDKIYQSMAVSDEDILNGSATNGTFRIMYTPKSFQKIAKAFGLMWDLKSGVPRTGYKGVVNFFYNNARVYLVPAFQPKRDQF